MSPFYVYIGPSIRGVIQHGIIRKGKLDEVKTSLRDAIAKYPAIAQLLISGDELPEARIKIKQPGNRLYEVNRRFLNELKKQGG